MIGIVVVTHSDFCEALLKTAEMIIGKQESTATVSLNSSEGLEDLKEKIRLAIEKVKSPEGVLIFTDMFGGSTSIVSANFLTDPKIEVITGVNLPILLEALLSREKAKNLNELSKTMVEKGKKSIVSISEVHKECR